MTTCTRGADALQLLRESEAPFDLVLSDVYMPDMDGFKLMEQVALELDVPVISACSPEGGGGARRGPGEAGKGRASGLLSRGWQ